MRFEAKLPGSRMQLAPVMMNFRYGSAFGMAVPEAYETLLLDAMLGDPTLFARHDFVEASWALITPVHEALARRSARRAIPTYEAGEWGPRRSRRDDGRRRTPLEDAVTRRERPTACCRTDATCRSPRSRSTLARLVRDGHDGAGAACALAPGDRRSSSGSRSGSSTPPRRSSTSASRAASGAILISEGDAHHARRARDRARHRHRRPGAALSEQRRRGAAPVEPAGASSGGAAAPSRRSTISPSSPTGWSSTRRTRTRCGRVPTRCSTDRAHRPALDRR